MAKGFKVVANAPELSTDEFDLERAKEMVKGKSIVFCLPGRGCSLHIPEKLCATMF